MTGLLLRWWAPYAVPLGAALALLALGPAAGRAHGTAGVAFAVVLVLTVACAVGAAVVLGLGLARAIPEVALLGSVLWTVSVLPMVHGLLLPGTLYGPNPGTVVAVMVAVPAALLAALPVLSDGTTLGRRLAARWRIWSIVWLVLPALAGAALLIAPRLIPAPAPGSLVALAIVAVSLTGSGWLSWRHLRLFALGRRAGSLLASLGFLAPGLATIAFLGAGPLSTGWWLAHATDGLGVLFAAGGLLVAHWRDRSLSLVLAPILTREPLAALELGLTPVVHRFLAALEAKDPVTRGHVVRVAELSMRAGERAGLDPVALRELGLGGLMHDVGKLLVPDTILTKPSALSDQERSVIERHTIDGEALVRPYPHLAQVAAIVRAHHERPDGRGYPDALRGEEIPRGAAIVSAADALDAMISDRPYRQGMDHDRATAILRGGARSQWNADAVEWVLAELATSGPVTRPRLDAVGRGEHATEDALAACVPGGPRTEHRHAVSAVDADEPAAIDLFIQAQARRARSTSEG